MNLSAYNKQGSNYQTEQIKCISPSTQILGLSNQDMQFYISKYGDKGYVYYNYYIGYNGVEESTI